jgi:hypothetical protein
MVQVAIKEAESATHKMSTLGIIQAPPLLQNAAKTALERHPNGNAQVNIRRENAEIRMLKTENSASIQAGC